MYVHTIVRVWMECSKYVRVYYCTCVDGVQ